MFTGIIEELGTIKQINSQAGKQYLTIECSKLNEGLKIGDSIACNGICLTLIQFTKQDITIEAMNETISKTTIKDWNLSSKINLERALRFNSRLDGHIVQGHIDTVSKIISVKEINKTRYIEIALPPEYSQLVVPQGSIAVNGVSLTIAKLEATSFQVALISLTENLTNLSLVKTGDLVNLEFDIIGKYILRSNSTNTTQTESKLTQAWLYEQGF